MIAAGENVISIPRAKIRPLYKQPRESFDYDRITELAASMRERGQLQPIIVRATGDATVPYELVDGERRWRAAEVAEVSHLLALVSQVGKGDEHYVQSVVANSAREDLTPMEQSRAVARIAMMPGYDPRSREGVAKLAAVFGRSPGWVAHMLKLDQLAPEVKTLVEERKLPAMAAAQLASVKSPFRQAEIGKRIASHPMRSSAVDNATRNAVRVEHVREGREVKVPGTNRGSAVSDLRLVAELVGRVAESAESLLDLPVARLRDAYAGKTRDLSAVIDRTQSAIAALQQLQQALVKLPKGSAK